MEASRPESFRGIQEMPLGRPKHVRFSISLATVKEIKSWQDGNVFDSKRTDSPIHCYQRRKSNPVGIFRRRHTLSENSLLRQEGLKMRSLYPVSQMTQKYCSQ